MYSGHGDKSSSPAEKCPRGKWCFLSLFKVFMKLLTDRCMSFSVAVPVSFLQFLTLPTQRACLIYTALRDHSPCVCVVKNV